MSTDTEEQYERLLAMSETDPAAFARLSLHTRLAVGHFAEQKRATEDQMRGQGQ